ncbi:CinA family protein [Sediminicoccus sp. BL-A-41-H5]|uniref:CinA family protein n=1 Tax=Sediminicoccus sp. BL-A-41-H5 TaxID=3421106 RepID=UPI003D66EB09
MEAVLAKAAALGERLRARGETIAVSESSSGGLVSAALLALPGASAYFMGGAVTYTAAAREALAGITAEQMVGLRSASEPYALLLARTMRERLGTTWGLAETGASGPTGNRYGDAAGHSCLAISGPVELVRTLETGHGERWPNMLEFALAALGLLDEALSG